MCISVCQQMQVAHKPTKQSSKITLFLLSEQKLLMGSQGWALQQSLEKSIIVGIAMEEQYYTAFGKIYTYPMQKTSSMSKLHTKNMTLHRVTPHSGAIGEKHSKLIDKLAAQVETRTKQLQAVSMPISEQLSQKEKELLKRIQNYDREESTLKREMVRISEMAKYYKNSKIQIEIKNQSLVQELSKCKKESDQMKLKIDLLTQLNAMLIKIAQNTLQILPHYTNDCQELFTCIQKVKVDLSENASSSSALGQLKRKLQSFKNEMDNMQTFNKKLIAGLAQAQQETKSISQRISLLQELNIDDLVTLKHEITQLQHPLSESSQSETEISPPSGLGLYSRTVDQTIIPQQTSRMNKILQEICLLFEQHIHLLQTQKMEYQFTKNKKLITAQKFSCEICESYEKIVSQIFSIVREAFKEIKFQFLREIKQVNDISEIPFLI